MIVPTNLLSTTPASPLGANDNTTPPSLTNMLMAAAQMHKMGRLAGTPKPAPKPKTEGED